MEADRMRVSRQRAAETLVHPGTRLEAKRSRSRRRREARIPMQAEDPETNYVMSLHSAFNACIRFNDVHIHTYIPTFVSIISSLTT